MTPDEKAKELVDKFKPMMYCYVGSGMLTNDYSETLVLSNAKQCALIAVDEIIKELHLLKKPEYTIFIDWEQLKEREEAETWDGYERLEYWGQKIKTAIQNL